MQAFLLLGLALILCAPAGDARGEAELEPGLEAALGSSESASEAAESSPPEAPAGEVARAAFTTAIVEREPTDAITTLSNDHRKVYYFTELRGLEGTTVTHRWEYNGEPVAEVFFEVRGPRWRVYSSKNLPETALGEWSVSVVDDMNRVLRTDTFLYTKASPPPRSATPATPEPSTPPAAPEPEDPQASAEKAAPSAPPAPGAGEPKAAPEPAPAALEY